MNIDGLYYDFGEVICDRGYIVEGSNDEYLESDSIKIPTTNDDPILEIGVEAFAYNNITFITMPDTITRINEGAFSSCNLTNIILSRNLRYIGRRAFEYCFNLSGIVIPDGVTEIKEYTFEQCQCLSKVVFPKNLTEIGAHAFDGCELLSDIELPDSVSSIGEYAFYECHTLKEVNIPKNVKEIESNAFSYCDELYKINLEHVIEIGESAFALSDLSEVVFPRMLHRIEGGVFQGCSIDHIDWPAELEYIGDYAFCGCRNLTEIYIPDGVTEIGDSAFKSCRNLQRVVIPNSVGRLGYFTFMDCINLTEVTMPYWLFLQAITNLSFRDCCKLQKINITDSREMYSPNLMIGCDMMKEISYKNQTYPCRTFDDLFAILTDNTNEKNQKK